MHGPQDSEKELDLQSRKDLVSRMAATLSLVEVGIGSIVHGTKLPFGGQLLSINQGLFLTRSVKTLKAHQLSFRDPIYISTIAATLKSLSPAGGKLGPMLSISMQGFLFSIGVGIFGGNILGVIIGMSLLSTWAFVQPFLMYYLFFGNHLFEAIHFYLEKMSSLLGVVEVDIVGVLSIVVAGKALLAATLGVVFFLMSDTSFERYLALTSKVPAPRVSMDRGTSSPFLLAARDMMRPFFLFSVALMVLFFFYSTGNAGWAIWMSLRPLAVAFSFFVICRHPLTFRFARYLRDRGVAPSFFEILEKTASRLAR